jgi:hypothetical protein
VLTTDALLAGAATCAGVAAALVLLVLLELFDAADDVTAVGPEVGVESPVDEVFGWAQAAPTKTSAAAMYRLESRIQASTQWPDQRGGVGRARFTPRCALTR